MTQSVKTPFWGHAKNSPTLDPISGKTLEMHQSTIAFDTPINLVRLVAVGSLNKESFSFQRSPTLDTIVDVSLQYGDNFEDPQINKQLWDSLSYVYRNNSLRRHAKHMKRLLRSTGRVEYKIAQGEEREIVKIVESSQESSRFGDYSYITDGDRVEFECQLFEPALQKTSDLGLLNNLVGFRLPDAKCLSHIKADTLQWYFIVELVQPLKGNATGIESTGGSSGERFQVVMIDNYDSDNIGPFQNRQVPKIILHDIKVGKDSIINILGRWASIRRILNDLNSEFTMNLSLADSHTESLARLKKPIPAWSSINRVKSAHRLGVIQAYVAQSYNYDYLIDKIESSVKRMWSSGKVYGTSTVIHVSKYINQRQVEVLDKDHRKSLYIEKIFQDQKNSMARISRRVSQISAFAGPMATSYQTQSSTAAEVVGILSAIVAIAALIISLSQKSDQLDAVDRIQAAAACTQLSIKDRQGFEICRPNPTESSSGDKQ